MTNSIAVKLSTTLKSVKDSKSTDFFPMQKGHLELGRGYQRLLDQGFKQSEIAKIFGITDLSISQSLMVFRAEQLSAAYNELMLEEDDNTEVSKSNSEMDFYPDAKLKAA